METLGYDCDAIELRHNDTSPSSRHQPPKPPTPPIPLHHRTAAPLPQQRHHRTAPPPPPIGAISCFTARASSRQTSVAGCRPTLNYFRSFPNYRLVQDFLQGGLYPRPRIPSKPPYAVHHLHSDCAVQIASEEDGVRDDFSFEQARALATEILETCMEMGGRGGRRRLGMGWGGRLVLLGGRSRRGGEGCL